MQRCCIHKTYISRSIFDSINICIDFAQFVHRLYVQKTYKDCFSQLVSYIILYICTLFVCAKTQGTKAIKVSQFHRFCIIYTLFQCTKYIFQVSSRFQSELCTSFEQIHFLYICRDLMQAHFLQLHSLSNKILICTIFVQFF